MNSVLKRFAQLVLLSVVLVAPMAAVSGKKNNKEEQGSYFTVKNTALVLGVVGLTAYLARNTETMQNVIKSETVQAVVNSEFVAKAAGYFGSFVEFVQTQWSKVPAFFNKTVKSGILDQQV